MLESFDDLKKIRNRKAVILNGTVEKHDEGWVATMHFHRQHPLAGVSKSAL
jgi:hypothetical protein